MPISTQRLAEFWKGLQGAPKSAYNDGRLIVAYQLLLESLPPTEKRIYEWYVNTWLPSRSADELQSGGGLTAALVSTTFDMEINQASTILKRLHSWGILHRKPIVDDNGLHYEYS